MDISQIKDCNEFLNKLNYLNETVDKINTHKSEMLSIDTQYKTQHSTGNVWFPLPKKEVVRLLLIQIHDLEKELMKRGVKI